MAISKTRRISIVDSNDATKSRPILLGLDSVDALELVVLVEEKFNIQIPDENIGKQAFASIDALTEYVSTELSKSPA